LFLTFPVAIEFAAYAGLMSNHISGGMYLDKRSGQKSWSMEEVLSAAWLYTKVHC